VFVLILAMTICSVIWLKNENNEQGWLLHWRNISI